MFIIIINGHNSLEKEQGWFEFMDMQSVQLTHNMGDIRFITDSRSPDYVYNHLDESSTSSVVKVANMQLTLNNELNTE